MFRKTTWILVSCFMALSLILISCAPAAEDKDEPKQEEEKPKDETPKDEAQDDKEEIVEEEAASPDKPQYGGKVRMVFTSDITSWDEVFGFLPGTMDLTNEELWTGDWARGQAGTGEVSWDTNGPDVWEYKTGALAESWEISAPDKSTWNIRKGVRWGLNVDSEASVLVGGREVTADDIASTLTMYRDHDRAFIHRQPGMSEVQISAPDKYTVVLEYPASLKANAIYRYGDFARIVPPEVVEKYGDMTDWKNSVGSGPFMLIDYVPSSQALLVKNPTYWRTNPTGPGEGDQLPYVDEVEILIITDASTREAAFRTGKIDQFAANWENFAQLSGANLDIKSSKYILDGGSNDLHFNTQHSIYGDVRVRRALMMATDWPSMVDGLFGGEADLIVWPATYNAQYAGMYLGLDDPEVPDEVKELYSYNPEKAKELLTEAGYPDGFKGTVFSNNLPARVDFLSVLKDNWAKVGVELNIEIVESGAYSAIVRGIQWDEMAISNAGGLGTQLSALTNIYGTSFTNSSRVSDPVITEGYNAVTGALATENQETAMALHKELMKYVLAQAYVVNYPKAPNYAMWWPWLKNYTGEVSVGTWNRYAWPQYVWIDQELKASMGY